MSTQTVSALSQQIAWAKWRILTMTIGVSLEDYIRDPQVFEPIIDLILKSPSPPEPVGNVSRAMALLTRRIRGLYHPCLLRRTLKLFFLSPNVLKFLSARDRSTRIEKPTP